MKLPDLSPMNPLRKVYRPLVMFIAVFFGGIVGYMLIEDYSWFQAVYMTVITVSTTGYGELFGLSEAGRAFTAVLIIANLGVVTYALTLLTQYFLDGEFRKDIKIYRMRKNIDELRGHVIVCGLGRNGRSAVRTLNQQGITVVAIDSDKDRIDNCSIPLEYAMHADSTKDETLLEAGIMHARSLITTLPNDADNVFTVLTARELNQNVLIISRASNDTSMSKLRRAGAHNIIMPDKLGGAHMAALVTNPDITEFMDLLSTRSSREFMMREIHISKGITLNRVDLLHQTGATVLGVRKSDGDYIFNPANSVSILDGCRLIVMGSEKQISDLEKALGN
jgi:voltage-gated potassium channel